VKILFVDIQYDYGDPKRGINTIGEYGFRRAMVSLGHEVIPFYYDDDLGGSDELQKRLLAKAADVRPDLITFCLFRNQFRPETLDALKKIAPTLNWFGDDTWRFESFTSRYAPHFTYNVTTDKFSVPKYHAIGVKNVIVSQWAAIDLHARPKFDGQYLYDVSFVGQFHPYRAWIINTLRNAGVAVEAFGLGWPNGPLSSEKMNHLFRHTKVNLNIGNSTSWNPHYLVSHWKALPLALKSRKTRSQIKARNFEIPYFGGFQVSDDVPGLEDWFEIIKEIVTYKTPDEAVEKVLYYLKNDRDREIIRLAGETRAQDDGYSARWKQILEYVERDRKLALPHSQGQHP
jgi:spore maturation protein CgeB